MNDTNLKSNPLLTPSTLPHGAFPFDQLKVEHFEPALIEAIKIAKRKIESIKNDKSPATFENVFLALETSSEDVGRASGIFFNLLSADTNDRLQELAKVLGPKLADFSSDIALDEKIFARVREVWENREKLGLKGEELRLAEKSYKDFVRNGALLSEDKKQKLRQIDQDLSLLSPQFSENQLKSLNSFRMVLDNPADLSGLPESIVEAAGETAKEKGMPGNWVITLDHPSYLPFMTYADREDLRERIWRAREKVSFRDEFDNEPVAIKTAKLRHDRAVLLGYKTHAHFVLEERMAESPEKVTAFLERLLEKAKPAAERDLQSLKDLKKEETGETKFMPWDYAYWSERLKMKKYQLDDELLRPYFQLENVIEGVFEHARKLYGLKFEVRKDIPVYHPDVKVFEVTDLKQKFVGLFYCDFFPRPSKQSGAWATTLRDQGLISGKVERPHSSIVCNFPKSTPTTPSLLTLDDVRTLFHEFGHALHSLLSDVRYVSLAGTNVYWDFVELPSQIMENWALEEEGLDLFARHYQTGEKMPRELIDRIRNSARYQAGWMTVRQIRFALLDMAWHWGDPSGVTDVEKFEKDATKKTQLLPTVEGTNSSCSFAHIFAGGYSAGYYSYKWAEVLDADAFEMFKEHGLFNSEVAAKFRDHILSRGGTEHPMILYKAFRGREPDPDALLRRDGLI